VPGLTRNPQWNDTYQNIQAISSLNTSPALRPFAAFDFILQSKHTGFAMVDGSRMLAWFCAFAVKKTPQADSRFIRVNPAYLRFRNPKPGEFQDHLRLIQG
jgi:hypothetical protein